MQSTENNIDKTKVFVVHGRNEELRRSMFEFLRSIGLKPIEWGQAIQMTSETAPFIGDILDVAFRQVQAVVVLLSGDDEARLLPKYYSDKLPEYEKKLMPQRVFLNSVCSQFQHATDAGDVNNGFTGRDGMLKVTG